MRIAPLEARLNEEGSVPRAETTRVMKTIQAEVSGFLASRAADAAATERTMVDQIIAIALSFQISVRKVRDAVAQRAIRGCLRDLDDVLAAVPELPGGSGDEEE